MSAVTFEWQEYETDSYEKRLQDIRLKDGREFFECWPNAGKWHVLSDDIDPIPDEQVTHVKLNEEERY